MMIQTVDIPFRLPTMNEIIRLQSRMDRRTGHNEWNNLKHAVERKICFCLRGAKIKHIRRIDYFIYTWRCPKPKRGGRRPDKSNITGGGIKVIEDALVKYGAIFDDGWDEIGDSRNLFDGDAETWGVTVEMHSEDFQAEIDFEKNP